MEDKKYDIRNFLLFSVRHDIHCDKNATYMLEFKASLRILNLRKEFKIMFCKNWRLQLKARFTHTSTPFLHSIQQHNPVVKKVDSYVSRFIAAIMPDVWHNNSCWIYIYKSIYIYVNKLVASSLMGFARWCIFVL